MTTPAAIAALARGELANFIAASTPGGIERQEAQGQRDMLASTHLPKKIRGVAREDLEALGFVFGAEVDELFIECTLPAGWSKVGTSHSMHSDLIDAQSRKRGGVFYKAAFYDRRADMRLNLRYWVDAYGDGPSQDESTVKVIDNSTGGTVKEFGTYSRKTENYWEQADKLEAEARAWLSAEFPEHQNPLAYWD